MEIFIYSYYCNKILRVYYNCISENSIGDNPIDENKLYLEIFQFCKQNRQLFENIGFKVFTYGHNTITECKEFTECKSFLLQIKGLQKFNIPIYFNYAEDENILFSQIYLQPIRLCNKEQKNEFYKLSKLIIECKQFINFSAVNANNGDVILLNNNVVGYIECVNIPPFDNVLQCFILPEFRKSGIAEFAHRLLFSKPNEDIKYTICILSHNIAAAHLYNKLKFTQLEEGHTINDLEYEIYELQLPNTIQLLDTIKHSDNVQLLDTIKHSDNVQPPCTWSTNLKDNFPYRKYYIPSFEIMYNNLKTFKEQKNNDSRYLYVVDRTFPEDYNNADSIVDHFAEDIRIHCAERNEKSPYNIWEENKDKFLEKTQSIPQLRELVYDGARGCNIFNVSLGISLFTYFNATSLLDCTAGWGDRLIAASIAGVKFYRGWDTNVKLQPKYNKIYEKIFNIENTDLQKMTYQMDWRIFCAPFEKTKLFNKDSYDGQNLYEKFDVAFLSPPFYDKELYEGELTSTKTYKSADDWYANFYRPMFKRAAMAVRPDGHILAYIPDGRMRKEANFTLEKNGFKYLGIVAFRTIVENKKPQVRDTFVWKKVNSHLHLENSIDHMDNYIHHTGHTTIKELLPIKQISKVVFKLGQNFAIYNNNAFNGKITSEEKFKSINNAEVMELLQSVKKRIIINILTYKILINDILIYKFYLSEDDNNTQKIISINSTKIKNEINKIIKKIPNIDNLQPMSMITCEFSIDNEDVIWVTNIYENKEYICPIHKEMILNQLKLYHIYTKEKIITNIKIKENGNNQTFSILYLKKNIGVIKIEKNHYGVEIFIYIKPKYRKKEIIKSIFIILYEYIHFVKYNELTYIEVLKKDKDYLDICHTLNLKDITAYGHISSHIFKF